MVDTTLGWQGGKDAGGPYGFPPREEVSEDKSKDAPAIDRPPSVKAPAKGAPMPSS